MNMLWRAAIDVNVAMRRVNADDTVDMCFHRTGEIVAIYYTPMRHYTNAFIGDSIIFSSRKITG